MRWRSRPRKPAHWNIRRRSGFLWLPKRIFGEWRWLEHAAWQEHFEDPEGDSGHWVADEWLGARSRSRTDTTEVGGT